MEVFHKRISFPIHNVVVRLRQGYGGTDFLRLLRIRFTPCQSTLWSRDGLPRRKKSRQIFWRLLEVWWSISGLNRWPRRCQRRALANWANTPQIVSMLTNILPFLIFSSRFLIFFWFFYYFSQISHNFSKNGYFCNVWAGKNWFLKKFFCEIFIMLPVVSKMLNGK